MQLEQTVKQNLTSHRSYYLRNLKMKFKPAIKPYDGAAGGWEALESTTRYVLDSKQTFKNIRNLLRVNKSKGFDCPGCAWGDNNGTFSFCENGAKAVSWEATRKAVDAAFFARHTVSQLYQQSDYFLEYQGRLREPLRYNAESDKYLPIRWEDAFALIANHLQDLAPPISWSSTPPAAPAMKPPISISCSAACSAPIISPTAPTCAMRPAVAA
ncbi:hypothetical protein SODG_004285 [Sodalis praecaptivus]